MHIITDRITGREIAQQEEPYYVHIGRNGSWQKCKDDDEPYALSVHGTLYKLEEMEYPEELPDGNWARDEEGEVPTVTVSQKPLGEITHTLGNEDAAQAVQIGDLEEATCEQAVTLEERLAQIEEALCEIVVSMTEV